MKLSISNIAWEKENDENVYEYLKARNFRGLEIAPTRIFPENPYDKLGDAKIWSKNLSESYGLKVSSMQSIWFGRNENIFESLESRNSLFEYTKKAIEFANVIGCKNLVFGCPKNRNLIANLDYDTQYEIARKFFKDLGEYAKKNNTYLSMEPNPVIYNTNFINTTSDAFKLVRDTRSDGIKVNIDFGTIIQNKEKLEEIKKNYDLINHIHISEPFLECIKIRSEHRELAGFLNKIDYNNFVSIEMKNLNDLGLVFNTIKYIGEVFI